eukprot:650570-Pyramimonas_sp.AAC.1
MSIRVASAKGPAAVASHIANLIARGKPETYAAREFKTSLRSEFIGKHHMIEHDSCPPLGKVPKVKTACERLGMCVCKPTREQPEPGPGYLPALMANAVTKSVFRTLPPELQSESKDGYLVVCLACFDNDNGVVERYWLHVASVMYHVNATFWVLEGPQGADVPREFMAKPLIRDERPDVVSCFRLCCRLDSSLRWSVSYGKLNPTEMPLNEITPTQLE